MHAILPLPRLMSKEEKHPFLLLFFWRGCQAQMWRSLLRTVTVRANWRSGRKAGPTAATSAMNAVEFGKSINVCAFRTFNRQFGGMTAPSSLVIDFGKFKGRLVSELPNWYAQWLEDNGALRNKQPLRNALIELKKIMPKEPAVPTPQEVGSDPYRRTFHNTTPAIGAAAVPLAPLAPISSQVIFLDIETVYTTKFGDNEKTHLVQLGMVDGQGRPRTFQFKPPVHWDDVDRASEFFRTHQFDRFFAPSNKSFAEQLPAVLRWVWNPEHGRPPLSSVLSAANVTPIDALARGPTPDHQHQGADDPLPFVVMVGHNLFNYDKPILQMELARAGVQFASTMQAGAAGVSSAAVAKTFAEHFFNSQVICIDSLHLLQHWSGLRRSPLKGTWTLSNVYAKFTGHGMFTATFPFLCLLLSFDPRISSLLSRPPRTNIILYILVIFAPSGALQNCMGTMTRWSTPRRCGESFCAIAKVVAIFALI